MAPELMTSFAARTGLDPEGVPRRYLWTDAFAVCNCLALGRATADSHWRDLALRLVAQVHHVLGRHRPDERRRGWISGLPESEGEQHPTQGGLRIGKPLPERGPRDPADETLEWDRDGQYFHYLTKWMHALDQVGRATGDPSFARWARELGEAAHRAFLHRGPGGQRMFWKMSVDLSRPLVSSMGQHDPLDGYVTSLQLDLAAAAADYAGMVHAGSLPTADPLGLGGLLSDAWRLVQLERRGIRVKPGLVDALIESAAAGLEHFLAGPDLGATPNQRLAFRELGLAIGLSAAEAVGADKVVRLGRSGGVREAIESFWLVPEHRASRLYAEHQDINDVMLATALVPAGYLSLE